uniref:Transposon protein, putative, ping/pong/SNOOPY sub-class n=1 Tax=Oryza sativa subsp. japonica TaxID=39947 RepID=Q53NY3_ORYSJ|nr:transposon protein, putative, ping/pong/SNOOPY sub-class [Oryza sativa Japonica Group]
MSPDGSGELDPSKIIEQYIAEQGIIDSFARRIMAKIKTKLRIRKLSKKSVTRKTIKRDHADAHHRLVSDYFSEDPLYPERMFRTRFQMGRPLFSTHCEFPCLDEYLKIGKSTSLQCLDMFARGVIEVFGPEFLQRPTCEDVERLLQVGESRGFPGMLGSIDCMHWRWEKCPTAWSGQFTRGDYGVPTIILEAVASYDLRIWHAFFGVAGSNNDINVLNQSPLFLDVLKGDAPQVKFSVNGNEYSTGYYLANGIYPEWAAFVKSIHLPQTEKHKLYAQYQEGARKDVECAFGVLQSRFNIVRRPARSWKRKSVGRIMKACVILHNMIVEDEREGVIIPIDLNENLGASIVLPPEVTTGDSPCFFDVLRRKAEIRARAPHSQVSKMLILAACFGSASAREATYYIIFSNPPILSKQNLCSNYLLSMSLYGSLLWPMNDVWIIVID